MRKFIPFVLLFIVITVFFKDFVFRGLIPLPADTIVGMYHPWRDFYAKEYPRGIPFKNPLITDPVRQQYPWKWLAIDYLKQGKLPIWNPYSFAGTPLLANFQSGVFYPLNIIFFLLPFNISWGIYIFLQYLLGGIFMFLYLENLNLKKEACLLGAISFIFSGVFIAWGWWGNIIHTLIWLPLLLLCIDKIVKIENESPNLNFKNQILKPHFKFKIVNRKSLFWSTLFIIAFCSSFFAGHLQIFFYVFITTLVYIIAKIILSNKDKFILIKLFTINFSLFTIITSVQWVPTINFINQSARSLDQADWHKEGWFLPWQHLVQFLVPDFFGNPATGNYWGVWNYGEFVGYIGILPIIFSLYALTFRKDKKTLFFGALFFLCLIFALPTPFARLPFIFKIPLISTSQPTRLMIIADFSLSMLAALGLDLFLKNKNLKILLRVLLILVITFILLWIIVIFGKHFFKEASWIQNLFIAKRNLIFPTSIFIFSTFLLILLSKINKIRFKILIINSLFLILVIDLFRFGWKFLPFTEEKYIFPKTKTIDFLQKKQKEEDFRIMSTDERIFPPNFSIVYKIKSLDGYDPLYLKTYQELINTMEGRAQGSSFNRIVTPKNYHSPLTSTLKVKYILSLSDISDPKLLKVFQEGETRVYEKIK